MSDTRSDQPRRFVIRHVSGSKVNQVEEFPFDQFDALLFGRAATSTVRYDPEHDELVSREHARITRDEADPSRYTITDLGSRNGTFLNKVQVAGSATIRPGDTVQLGAGGPEFLFDLEPHPPGETRIAPAMPAGKPTLASSPALTPDRATSGTAQDRPPQKVGVGRETVERMMVDVQRTTQKKTSWMLFAGGGVLLLLLAVSLYFVNAKTNETGAGARAAVDSTLAAQERNRPLTPAEIAAAHGDAVVFIQSSWRLMDTNAQTQVYHQFQPTELNGQTVALGMFVQLPTGQIEPILTTSDQGGLNKPIASSAFGSGFVVSQDGFIMTNRHVVRGWHYPYQFPQGPAVLYKLDPTGTSVASTELIDASQVAQWVPAESAFYNDQFVIENLRPLDGEGAMQVTFQNSDNPTEARFVRDSPRADAALIKIDPPDVLHAVTMNDTYETTAVGDPVTIMGYPGVSGFDIGTATNVEMGARRQMTAQFVPRVTVTPANISSIHRSRRSGENPDERVISMGFPDAYQLSTSETGGGNSGGPVFNEKGEVIGIFTYASQRDARVTYAIPIKYAMELRRTTGTR